MDTREIREFIASGPELFSALGSEEAERIIKLVQQHRAMSEFIIAVSRHRNKKEA